MANSKRRCTYCKTYHKADSGIVCNVGFFCSDDCRHKYGMKDIPNLLQHTRKQKEKEFNKETKRRKEALKTKPELEKEAQTQFNKFIRLRDIDEPCISCGREVWEVERDDIPKLGGYWDAGHFIGVGASKELRFTELNCHKQCKTCNGGAGQYAKKNHTVTQAYRLRLIEKIGSEAVEWLEGPHDMPNRTHDELRKTRNKYRIKAGELKKLLAA